MLDAAVPFDNAFIYLDTYGLPLLDILRACTKQGVAVNLDAFYRDAAKAGWTQEKTKSTVREALVDGIKDHFIFCAEGA